jgi:hypothetical protein
MLSTTLIGSWINPRRNDHVLKLPAHHATNAVATASSPYATPR